MKTNEIAKIIETDPQTIFYSDGAYGMRKMFRIINTVDEINSGKTAKGFNVRPVWIGWNQETNSHSVTTSDRAQSDKVRNFRITGVWATTDQEAIERQIELEQKREEDRKRNKALADQVSAKRAEMHTFSVELARALGLQSHQVGVSYTGAATFEIKMSAEQAAALVARLNDPVVLSI